MILYRPVGLYELALVARTAWRTFPPRLPEQPIFYPVLDRTYADEIASRWNPPDPNSGFAGFVTRFSVPDPIGARYPAQTVGARRHRELWVPAEEQAAFEAHFVGPIEPLAAWVGPRIRDALPSWEGPAGPVDAADLPALILAAIRGPLHGGPLTLASPG